MLFFLFVVVCNGNSLKQTPRCVRGFSIVIHWATMRQLHFRIRARRGVILIKANEFYGNVFLKRSHHHAAISSPHQQPNECARALTHHSFKYISEAFLVYPIPPANVKRSSNNYTLLACKCLCNMLLHNRSRRFWNAGESTKNASQIIIHPHRYLQITFHTYTDTHCKSSNDEN